jgi:hypothetical protein
MGSYVYSFYDTINIRNGNVGIGTLTPKEAFHVQGGSVYIERITNDASNIDLAYSTLSNVSTLRVDKITGQSGNLLDMNANFLSNIDRLSINTFTSDTSNIYYDQKVLTDISFAEVTYDVTVGRTLFASNLQVLGEFTTMNTLTSNTEQMTITNDGSGPALIVRQTGNESVATFFDDNAVAMYIGGASADAGFVGIGTGAADNRLHIFDTNGLSAHIQTTNSNLAQVKMTNMGGDTYIGPSAIGTVDFMSTASQPIRIGTSNAEYLRVDTLGNVGIASAAPLYKLDVAGTTRVQDALYLATQGMNTIFYSFGGQVLTNSNTYIGLTMSWANLTTDNKLAFRVQVKCHLASDDSIVYRKFESLITPANDSANGKPKQVVATEIADTNTDDFSQMTHTVTRNDANTVDLRVAWTTAVTSYIGNVQVEVFASTSLGDFTFVPIYG